MRWCSTLLIPPKTPQTKLASTNIGLYWVFGIITKSYRDQDIDTGDADDVSEEDWNTGYNAGVAAAQADSDNLEEYNDELAFHRSADYNEGYRDGYSSTYFVDWHQRGYDWAERDVEANRAYDDTPPVSWEDDNDKIRYREGYANGWRDAKVNRL